MTDTTLAQRHPLEAYADSYAQMRRTGHIMTDCRSVESDIRQNMIPATVATAELDRLTEANKALEAERDVARHHTSNLLALIHRDGGHYESEHGTSKAAKDADEIIAKLHADENSAEAKLAKVEAERDALIEDRARFPDRPDGIGRTIEAHIGNLKSGKEAADSHALKAMSDRDRLSAELAEARAALHPFDKYVPGACFEGKCRYKLVETTEAGGGWLGAEDFRRVRSFLARSKEASQ